MKIEDFIDKAKIKHNNKYQYIINNDINNKIDIICEIHGVFNQRKDHHLNGSGCPKCVGRNKNNLDLIEDFKKIHGDRYDYSLVDYKNALTKVKIICKEHGIFYLHPRQHLRGVNCSICERKRIADSQKKTTQEFINQSKLTHGDKYDYSLSIYDNAKTKVKIICKEHGVFEQIPRYHVSGCGCPICKESKGERKIRMFLEENNILFLPQYKFMECKNKRPLPFDFYLPEKNMCIEYNGIQHYNDTSFYSIKRLEKIQKHDNIKIEYCIDNNIKIHIISYKDFNNIESILTDLIL